MCVSGYSDYISLSSHGKVVNLLMGDTLIPNKRGVFIETSSSESEMRNLVGKTYNVNVANTLKQCAWHSINGCFCINEQLEYVLMDGFVSNGFLAAKDVAIKCHKANDHLPEFHDSFKLPKNNNNRWICYIVSQ